MKKRIPAPKNLKKAMKITSNRIVREALEKSTGSSNESTPTGMGDAELSKCCGALTMKEWKTFDGEYCFECGDIAEVFTSEKEGYYGDGDDVRCAAPDCPEKGVIIVDEEYASVDWINN